MRDALKSYLALATGVTDLTRQAALAAARALVNQGEATAEQVTGLAEDLLAQTRQNREAVVALVSNEVDRALTRVGLASADEVVALVQRVRELESQLQSTAATVGVSGPGRAATSAAPARSTGGGPEDSAPVKRKAAKQAATAKAVRRRQPSSTHEQPSAAEQKPAAKQPAAKKAPAKKAPAKKAPAKKAPAGDARAEQAADDAAERPLSDAHGTGATPAPGRSDLASEGPAGAAPADSARAARSDPAAEPSSTGGQDDAVAAGTASAAPVPEPGESPA